MDIMEETQEDFEENYSCPLCGGRVTRNGDILSCDKCNFWVHEFDGTE